MKRRPNYYLYIGGVLTAVTVITIIIGFFWTPYDPNAVSAASKFASPSIHHILGCDNMGRDIFSRVIEGAGTTLIISAATVIIGTVIGTLLGAFTGYYGGLPDEILMRICDAITAFPSILLALVLVSIMGSGKYNIIIILGILFVPSYSRILRSEYAKCRELNYVKNAKIMGAGDLRIMFVHILPNIIPVLLPAVTIGFNNAVLAEASMSFLSIGVQPPDPSLGRMLSESQTYLFTAPWYALGTGFAIVILILAFSLLGEGLQRRNKQ